jgi:hypothetical protein
VGVHLLLQEVLHVFRGKDSLLDEYLTDELIGLLFL